MKKIINTFVESKNLRYLLVFVQFFVLLWLTVSYFLVSNISLQLLLPLLFIAFGLWAVLSMKFTSITPMPDPTKKSILTTKGPYRWLRHPMYTSVAGYSLSLLAINFSLANLLMFMFFCLAIFMKMQIEEYFLIHRYNEYEEYMKRTFRIIPFIY